MKKILYPLLAGLLVSCSSTPSDTNPVLEAVKENHVQEITLQDSLSNTLFAAQLEAALLKSQQHYQQKYDSLHMALEAYSKLGPARQALVAQLPKAQRQQLLGPLKEVLSGSHEPTKEELRELVENQTILRMALDSIALKYAQEKPILCYKATLSDGTQGFVYQNPNTQQTYYQAQEMSLQDLGPFAVQAAAAYAGVNQFYATKNQLLTEHLEITLQVLQNLSSLK